ncbi:MAG: tetratricopeptide repeat protein [Cyanobacteria bacterium SIG28]|nr:tetratricopeptide repeat protein [Cyanobacteria bacterium SIG28]
MTNSDYYIQDNSEIEATKFEAAKGLYQSGNYSGALKLYLDLVSASTSYKLYYEIGRCYYKLLDINNSELYFMRSIALVAHKNPSYLFLGNIFHKRGELRKAMEYWAKAFSFKPDEELACLNLATSYFSRDMKFQAIFYYEKYLRCAKDKNSSYYLEIKKTIDEFSKIGKDFYQKAQKSISMKDFDTAIQSLEYAAKNYPVSFDINFLLGKLYYDKKEFLKASIYLKQAFCLDNKSLDVLQMLSTALLEAGDFTAGYCCMRRILPLIVNNPKKYLEVTQTTKHLEDSFDKFSSQGHRRWADTYYNENNYHFALYEYENCLIIDGNIENNYSDLIDKVRSYINPEERIIKACFEKGTTLHSNGNYREANKYFSKILKLSNENSSDYKFAKSRLVDV